MDGRFTDEELAIAKSVDLCAVAESLGYTVKRIGKYHTLKEMDSIRIYNRSHWYRWSRQFDKGNNGGSQIDMQKDLFLDAKQEQLTKLSKLDEFDEEVIRYLIDYVLVYDNEHIEIRWNFDDFQAG